MTLVGFYSVLLKCVVALDVRCMTGKEGGGEKV